MSIGALSEYSTGSNYSPGLMGLGSGGSVWFAPYQGAGYSSPNVGKVDASGTITFNNTTTQLFDRNGIVLGPDGNEWFTDQTHDQVGLISANGAVTLYHLTTSSHPIGIVVGSDSALWIAENGSGKIGRITVQGLVTEYGSGLADIRSIALGADGNVWFTEHGNSKIGRIDTSGNITQFAVPSGGAPALIRKGPDGNVWFTEYESNRVGYATPSGAISEFSVQGGPNGITSGPDGNIWYTELSGNAIGSISPTGVAGAVIPLPRSNSQPYDIVATNSAVYFSERYGTAIGIIQVTPQTAGSISEVPTGSAYSPGFISNGNGNQLWFTPYDGSGYSSPSIGTIDQANKISFINSTTTLFDRNGIVLGPDGNEWFTDQFHDQVGYATPSGSVTLFKLTPGSHPIGITAGSDAALWFAENGSGKIGRITVQGTYTEYGSGLSDVRTVTLGADGNIWFSEHGNGFIGKITTAGAISAYQIPSGGLPAVVRAGPNGNVWFSEYEANRIGFVTSSGGITEYSAPGGPNGLVTGPDGNIWYAENTASAIGELSPTGTLLAQYATPTQNSQPYDIASTCNTIYFTERLGMNIGTFPVSQTATIGQVSETSTGSSYSPGFISLGNSGQLWFTPYDGSGYSSPNIGVVHNGAISFVNSTTALYDRNGIVLGPDANEWFTDQVHDQVGYVTPSGSVTLFKLSSGSHPIGITVGSDAALWFAENGAGKIGRITVQGTYTEYGSGLSDVRTVTRGEDGNVWFSEHGNGRVGNITTAGTISEYQIPSGGLPAVVRPGPNGNVWFSEYESNRIGFVTPGGSITEYSAPGGPNGLVAGPDGNIWYTENTGSAIGVLSPTGTLLAQYVTPTQNSQPYDITSTCNTVYFTERLGTNIGSIRVQ